MRQITDFRQIDLTKTYTYTDYLTWKFNEKVELIMGKIFRMSPAPSERHQFISLRITKALINILDMNPCRMYYAPFDVRLPKSNNHDSNSITTVVQPDIVIICDLSKIDEKGCFGPPDIVMEILSKQTLKKDLHEKYNLYQESGISEYWIIDPLAETVQVNTLELNKQYRAGRLLTRGDIARSNILTELALDLNEIFPSSVEEPEEFYGNEAIRI